MSNEMSASVIYWNEEKGHLGGNGAVQLDMLYMRYPLNIHMMAVEYEGENRIR